MKHRCGEQIAVVTGASRGIGLAAAKALAEEGAHIVAVSLNEKRAHAAAEAIRCGEEAVEFIQADVTRRDQVARVVTYTMKRHGRIDILVNNAGVHEGAFFCEEREDLWDRMFKCNVLGTVLITQEAVPFMKDAGSGAIVNIASKAGVVGEPGHTAYSASKGAVIAMTRGMAVELAPFGIRVNAVCPGPVETDMFFSALPVASDREKLARETPLGRVGKPADVAHAVVYLASKESEWCTGLAISVDGGLSILK